jgi:methionyl-tRNA formyltransferase
MGLGLGMGHVIDERDQSSQAKRSQSYGESGLAMSQPSSTRNQTKATPRKTPIVFFGNEKLATGIPAVQPLIREAAERAGFQIEKIVTGRLSELGSHKSKLAVLAAYGRIIPQTVLDQFPLGILNVHPSLLPAHRGPTPIEQTILDGVVKTGVSIMHLTAGMDEGPVYKQKTVHLKGRETKSELTKQLHQLGAEMIAEVLPAIAEGTLQPRNQSHPDRATYSHKLSKEDGVMDWHKSAEQLEREVRAFAGWPNSRTTLAGKDVIITEAAVVSLDGEPGSTIVEGRRLIVACKEGALEIIKLKPSGKNEMTGQAFLAGYQHLLKS